MGIGTTLVDTAVEELIAMILGQKLQPGDKLPNEYDLAGTLGIGRSTLREAIRRLVARNVLEVRQGSGTYISEKYGVPEDPLGLTFLGEKSDLKVTLDLIDIRLMIEPEICAELAIHATPEQVEAMMAHCDEVHASIAKQEDYSLADAQMHSYFAHCSSNKVLKNLLPIIGSSVHRSIYSTNDEHRQRTDAQHYEIIRAIAAHDAIGARCQMITHLATSRKTIVQALHREQKQQQQQQQ